MPLGFGSCKLQIQVPAKGDIQTADQLVGKNIVTSFTYLASAHFAKLEGGTVNGDSKSKLRTTVKYVSGSVEAACALGDADGIVDLVGKSSQVTWMIW